MYIYKNVYVFKRHNLFQGSIFHSRSTRIRGHGPTRIHNPKNWEKRSFLEQQQLCRASCVESVSEMKNGFFEMIFSPCTL